MLPIIATTLGSLATSVIERLLPNTAKDKLDLIRLEIERQAMENDVLKAQIGVNQAEAANPNRRFPTWRECLGYGLVVVVLYSFIIRPLLVDAFILIGLDVSKLPVLELANLFKVLIAMLGIGSI